MCLVKCVPFLSQSIWVFPPTKMRETPRKHETERTIAADDRIPVQALLCEDPLRVGDVLQRVGHFASCWPFSRPGTLSHLQ